MLISYNYLDVREHAVLAPSLSFMSNIGKIR